MSRVDAGYVAYLTRETAWLRAQLQGLVLEVEQLRAALEELRIETAARQEFSDREHEPRT